MTHEADLHLLAHTARMQIVLAGNAKHPRKREYVNQIAAYRARWAQIPTAEKRTLSKEAADLPDMTPALVKRAVLELES